MPAKSSRSRNILLGFFVLGLGLLTFFRASAETQSNDRSDIEAVRAQLADIGPHAFTADIEQTLIPRPAAQHDRRKQPPN